MGRILWLMNYVNPVKVAYFVLWLKGHDNSY